MASLFDSARRTENFKAYLLDPSSPHWPVLPPPARPFAIEPAAVLQRLSAGQSASGGLGENLVAQRTDRDQAVLAGEVLRSESVHAAAELADLEARIAAMAESLARYDWSEIMSAVQREGSSAALSELGLDEQVAEPPTVFLTEVRPAPGEYDTADRVRAAAAADLAKRQAQAAALERRAQRPSEFVGVQNQIVSVAKFPGFDAACPTALPLPEGMNAADCLLHVAKHMSIVPAMPLHEWRALFLSKASVDILLDAFWYTWCDAYMVAKLERVYRRKVLNALFDRLAANYYNFFESVPRRHKDDFFGRYANALSMALFYSYCQCFPQSVLTSFDEAFKARLVGTVFSWLTGAPPSTAVWRQWPSRLLPETKDMVMLMRETAQKAVSEFNATFLADVAPPGAAAAEPVPSTPAAPAPPGEGRPHTLSRFQRWRAERRRQGTASDQASESGGAFSVAVALAAAAAGAATDSDAPGEEGGASARSVRVARLHEAQHSALVRHATNVGSGAEELAAGPTAAGEAAAAASAGTAAAAVSAAPAPTAPPLPRNVYSKVPFNMNGLCPLIAHHVRRRSEAANAGRDLIIQRTEERESVGAASSYRAVATAVSTSTHAARKRLLQHTSRTRRELAANEANRREHHALISQATRDVLGVRNKAERTLQIRRYVDELVMRLIPEVHMAWVEEVEGTDAVFSVRAAGSVPAALAEAEHGDETIEPM